MTGNDGCFKTVLTDSSNTKVAKKIPPPFIIPIFIQNRGCPSICVFCNQFKTATRQSPPEKNHPETIKETVDLWLSRKSARQPHRSTEVAFYGGSFTGLPYETQKFFLESISEYIKTGKVDSIRISTRPDSLSPGILTLLKKNGVRTVELGVQSLDDDVLLASKRGHLAEDSIYSCKILKEHDFKVGIQLMPGLPDDSFQKTIQTTKDAIALNPDFVRIYPTVVVRGTKLAMMYEEGVYSPLTLEDGIRWCTRMLFLFQESGIPVIRTGLQPVDSLEKDQNILAGPYHPAFGQLVVSFLKYKILKKILDDLQFKQKSVRLRVKESDLSNFIGQKKENIIKVKEELGIDLSIEPLKTLKSDEVCIWCVSHWKKIRTGSNFLSEGVTCW